MRRAVASLPLAVLLAWATGCGGPTLTKQNVRTLRIGQTTESQVRATFGKPTVAEERSDGASTAKLLQYKLSDGGVTIIGYRSVDMRLLVAEIFDDRLHAWLYFSTAGKDATKIRASAVPQLVKGSTTRDEALRLLGEPAGQARRGTRVPDYHAEFGRGVGEICAWTAIDGAHGWYGQAVAARLLLVKFDAAGRVVDVVNRSMKG